MSNNAPVLGGIPVRELSAYAQEMGMEEKRETEVLIATPEQIQAEIEETLEKYGFSATTDDLPLLDVRN